jgi:predicted kinase
MVRRLEKLTAKEASVQEAFLANLEVPESKTKKPVIVGLVGLVGSGKSSVALELAKQIGGVAIEADAIRVLLRKQDERYERARAIAENIALEMVTRGGSAIIDSDFVDREKRAILKEKAKLVGANVVFVRVHCDFDVMVGRALQADYCNEKDDFFGGASSGWSGSSEQSKGAVVKAREMWRRTPRHYRWLDEGGGKWVLRKLPFAVFAEVDTTDEERWKEEVKAIKL